MIPTPDQTHDPKLTSWIDSANQPGCDFPIQNLPFGVFAEVGSDAISAGEPMVGVAIGDRVVKLAELAEAGLFESVDPGLTEIFDWWSLNPLLWEGPDVWRAVRRRLSDLFSADNPELRDDLDLRQRAILKMSQVEMLDPVEIGDYTDFYASLHHATNVGSMFRPDNPILPNYKHIPIGYHGRASSVVASGAPVKRPVGQQTPSDGAPQPGFGPCKMLDYEMEVAAFVGDANDLGETIPIDDAESRLFGLALCNDWSARDMQKWEYQPLGPFLAKSFHTTISPWIVTMDALVPYRVPAFKRDESDPTPLPYLTSDQNSARGGIALTVEVYLASAQMREEGMDPIKLSTGSFEDMYWTVAQMLTHHASNGCNMIPGDMFASGTVSGPERDNRGCLLELTWNGSGDDPKPGTDRTPIELPTGEKRTFLEDGDEVIMRGYCEAEGRVRIGFGECRGIVTPASV
jgi:fumarylacetoacetase